MTVGGTQTLTGKTLTSPNLTTPRTTSVVYAETDGATVTFNANNGLRQKVTLAGNRNLTVSNLADGEKMELWIFQDGTGSRTATWTVITIRWDGGSFTALTTTPSKADCIFIQRIGSEYFGSYATRGA